MFKYISTGVFTGIIAIPAIPFAIVDIFTPGGIWKSQAEYGALGNFAAFVLAFFGVITLVLSFFASLAVQTLFAMPWWVSFGGIYLFMWAMIGLVFKMGSFEGTK